MSPQGGCEIPDGNRWRSAPRTLRPQPTRLPLRDLGYVEGRRVHVLPEWGIPVHDGISDLLHRVAVARPEADAVVVGSMRAPKAIRRSGGDEPSLYCACPEEAGPTSDLALRVTAEGLREASALLRELEWAPFSTEAALALAGFWNADRETGQDVVIVLGTMRERASSEAV